MNQALLQRVLDGNQEAQAIFGEADNCAVIDWRDGAAEVVTAIAAFLPQGHLRLGRVSEQVCEILVRDKAPTEVTLSPKAMQENLLHSISNAIAPDYELRQYRPTDGDGYAVFVASRSIWLSMEREHPQATESLFLSAQRLAAHWSKSYLARLFSKP